MGSTARLTILTRDEAITYRYRKYDGQIVPSSLNIVSLHLKEAAHKISQGLTALWWRYQGSKMRLLGVSSPFSTLDFPFRLGLRERSAAQGKYA